MSPRGQIDPAYIMDKLNLGFLGIGKIATALVEGFCTSAISEVSIYLSPRNQANADRLSKKYAQVQKTDSNQEVLDHADIIFIALTPAAVTTELALLQFDPRHTVVSLVPLLKYADLEGMATPATQICRAIPLPSVVLHQCPIPLYQASIPITHLISHIGQPLPVTDEDQLHALWTLTGLITPFYEQLEALSNWTIAHGVSSQTANTYIANLYQSLAYMAQQASTVNFSELASHAATPRGMNEQAGKEIREKGAHDIYTQAAEHLLARFN